MVEDDELLTELLGHKLAEHFKMAHAGTGEEALKLVAQLKPDLVLLDILLPGIDGFEVLRKMKADAATAHIPVVILSNLGQPEDMEKGKQLGAEEFVVKVTLLPDEVVSLVEKVCDRTPKAAA